MSGPLLPAYVEALVAYAVRSAPALGREGASALVERVLATHLSVHQADPAPVIHAWSSRPCLTARRLVLHAKR